MHTPAPLSSPRAWRILTWCAIAAFAAFRLPELTRYSLWYDELFSLTLAQQDWGGLLQRAVADRTNPPLFYALLKTWISVGGESVAWMRLLPCLCGILVAIPVVALARRWLADLPAAIAVVAIGAASPLAVFLSNEIRGYSLLLLLSATSYLLWARLVHAAHETAPVMPTGRTSGMAPPANAEARRQAITLAAVNTALVYTHYFGWLVVAAQVGAGLFWHRRAVRRLLAVTAATAVAFAPWVLAVERGARGVAAPLTNVDWIGVPALSDIPGFYDALVARVITIQAAWVGSAVVIGGLVVLAFRAVRAGGGPAPRLAWLAAFPVLATYAASVVMHRSVFVPRYLVVAAPAWWLLMGLAAAGAGLAPRGRRIAAWGAALFAAFTLVAGAARERRGGEKIQWRDVVSAISADAGPAGGTVYSLEGFTALPTAYYAATLDTRLVVRPARDLSQIAPPAWLVVRASPGQGDAVLGAGLQIRGRTLTPIFADTVPSHRVTAFRVGVRESPR